MKVGGEEGKEGVYEGGKDERRMRQVKRKKEK